MKLIGRVIGLLFFVFILIISYAVSLDWSGQIYQTSPYGSYVYNNGEGGTSISYPKLGKIQRLNEWYFYRGYTVGTYGSHNEAYKRYFVMNERLHLLSTFDNQAAWKQFIRRKEIDPYFPRWWSGSWESNSFVIFLLSIPAFAGFEQVCRYLQRKKDWNYLFMLLSGTLIFVFVLFLGVALYDTTPQSWF